LLQHSINRFIILMQWGRVGSNLLMSMISQLGPAKLANERLNTLKGESEQIAWYHDFYEFANSEPSCSLISAKENILAITNPVPFTQMLLDHDVKVIRMRRDNLVKAAVSQIRGEQYAAVTKAQTGVARWGVRKGQSALGRTMIDPDLLLKRIEMMERAHTALERVLPPMNALDIEYEEINRDVAGVVRRVKSWLNIQGDRALKVPFEKATPDDLADAILNFDEVRQRLSESRYGDQL
jgi:hypothetical protein